MLGSRWCQTHTSAASTAFGCGTKTGCRSCTRRQRRHLTTWRSCCFRLARITSNRQRAPPARPPTRPLATGASARAMMVAMAPLALAVTRKMTGPTTTQAVAVDRRAPAPHAGHSPVARDHTCDPAVAVAHPPLHLQTQARRRHRHHRHHTRAKVATRTTATALLRRTRTLTWICLGRATRTAGLCCMTCGCGRWRFFARSGGCWTTTRGRCSTAATRRGACSCCRSAPLLLCTPPPLHSPLHRALPARGENGQDGVPVVPQAHRVAPRPAL